MKIEIAEPGRMTQTGSSLLKLIQNNDMPILDLLVRESIQNSLDAKIQSSKFVDVEYEVGQFNKESLNRELEGITCCLNARFPNYNYKYIAIRDYKTVGLTGPLHFKDVLDNEYGNLLKLVYEISRPQDTEGSGGSWGLGKTVYFRIGIGLVLYYSRVIIDGKYQSRLAASFVENELEDSSILPKYNGKVKRGIAWWGESIGENKTQPITNVEEIKRILKIFDISEYENNETGTTIIIPYINEEDLLDHNKKEYDKKVDGSASPYWYNSLEEYLKIAVQRWYAPRLNNPKYGYGPFLRVKINGIGLSDDDMNIVFKEIRNMYNTAFIPENCADIKKDRIILRKVLETTVAGTLVYKRFNKKQLEMLPPDNNLTPFILCNCDIYNSEKNRPIICFTRQPGMIVSYEENGKWVEQVNMTGEDEYLLAIFVLNTENKLSNGGCSLEEYIRKSEMADHSSWSDYTINRNNPRIVWKIQSQVSKKLAKETEVDKECEPTKLNTGLGRKLGELLLPPESFGNRSSLDVRGKSKEHIERHKDVIIRIKNKSIKYYLNQMVIPINITARKPLSGIGIEVAIDSDSGPIKVDEWTKKMKLKMPFEVIGADINYRDEDIKCSLPISIFDPVSENDDIAINLLHTDYFEGFGIYLSCLTPKKMNIQIELTLKMHRRNYRPLFLVMRNKGEE